MRIDVIANTDRAIAVMEDRAKHYAEQHGEHTYHPYLAGALKAELIFAANLARQLTKERDELQQDNLRLIDQVEA